MAPKREKWRFSARETRALLWLLPFLAIASWLVWEISCPRFATDAGDPEVESAHAPENFRQHGADAAPTAGFESAAEPAEKVAAPILFSFDPNTVEYHDLIRLGFTRGQALGIVKYRERGKIFEIPEDFAACYQVPEEMYLRLKPHIRIAEKYRLKKFISQQSGSTSAPTADNKTGSTQAGAPLSREIELNTADSAALRSVIGIGEKTVTTIMEYRARLGGFAAKEQLSEVRGVTPQNYERIVTQISIDTLAIHKIDINFASAKRLAAHPYIKGESLRKLLKHRQLEGGWSTATELVEDAIFTESEVAKLRPYLLFNN